MASNTSQKSTNLLLIFLLVLITFPIWIGLFGLMVGTVGAVIGGVFGAVFGVLGGLLGAIMGIITWPFKVIFGHGHWFPHINGYVIAALIILVLVIAKRNAKSA
jgi:hypothetical protein